LLIHAAGAPVRRTILALAVDARRARDAILMRHAARFAGCHIAGVIATRSRRHDAVALAIACVRRCSATCTSWRLATSTRPCRGNGTRAGVRALTGEAAWIHGIGCASGIRGDCAANAVSVACSTDAVAGVIAANVIDAEAGLALLRRGAA
jgi:hypothetical protein